MKKYTESEKKILKKNKYTLKITENALSHTAEFKKTFWVKYQAGMAPRKILKELNYDPNMFGQKRIDSLVQRIKKEALSGSGFTEGVNRNYRKKMKFEEELNSNSFNQMQHEILYLRQEVEFLKKITIENNSKEGLP